MTFIEFNKRFPTENHAINYFIKIRYQDKIVCPHCGASMGLYRIAKRPKYFICTSCRNSFSIFKNTIFQHSKIDIRKWFYAINIFLNDKKGVSACNLQREIGITYKAAWRMLQLIRAAMGNSSIKPFSTTVEVDETYVGGKPRYRNPYHKRGRGTKKTPVVGIIERQSRQVYARVMDYNAEGKALTGQQLSAFIEGKISGQATIMTDTFSGYNFLDRKYNHKRVNHSAGQYKAKGNVHTNNIENFWSIIKRSVIGVYHTVSKKHLQKYIDEHCYRANNRHNPAIFDQLLKQSIIPSANNAWKVEG